MPLVKRFVPITAKKNVPMVEIITSVWLEAVRTHLFFETHSFP